jgi:hypothetical protein
VERVITPPETAVFDPIDKHLRRVEVGTGEVETRSSKMNARFEHRDDGSELTRPPGWHPLQPLRIPAGWTVMFNNGFYEIDPHSESIPEHERLIVFKEDMFQMRHERANRLIDLGWYPEGDIDGGEYGLVVYEGDFHGRLLHQFGGRDRAALVMEIEKLLLMVTNGEL